MIAAAGQNKTFVTLTRAIIYVKMMLVPNDDKLSNVNNENAIQIVAPLVIPRVVYYYANDI